MGWQTETKYLDAFPWPIEENLSYSFNAYKFYILVWRYFRITISLFSSVYPDLGFPGGAVVKNLPANAGGARDVGLPAGSGRSPREGNGNPLQDSCRENPMDRGAWWATVHGVAKSQTWLSSHAFILV